MAFCFCQKIGSFGADITGNSVGFGVLGVVLDKATQCPWLSTLLEEIHGRVGWTYASVGQQGVNQEGAAKVGLGVAHGHVLNKGFAVEEGEEGIVPD